MAMKEPPPYGLVVILEAQGGYVQCLSRHQSKIWTEHPANSPSSSAQQNFCTVPHITRTEIVIVY